MSRTIVTGGLKHDLLNELDIDDLVERLTPGEIQRLLDECDPDDPSIPPSLRCSYKCEKEATGPLDRQKLLDFINDQALNTPDIPDVVPFVAGTVRGKKWTAPPEPEPHNMLLDESIELDIDIGEDCNKALENASTAEIVDLAGILGLHSMMNQDQYHASQSDKWGKSDPETGWSGVTKATPLKQYPAEEPNRTNPEEVISKISKNDNSLKSVNLNNIPLKDGQFLELFEGLRSNTALVDLSIANTALGDYAATNLVGVLEENNNLEKLNIESNNVSPQTLVKIFEAAIANQSLKDIKASNQKAHFLGNKAEMAITNAIEQNKSILKVGLHFQFGDCRNRVAVQLQKNLDRVRLMRLSQKISTRNGN